MGKIKFYESSDIDYHFDKEIKTQPPEGGETTQTFRSSSFERMMRLEVEHNKVHGRILKLIDTIKAHENDCDRLDFDRKRHEFNKQRVKGEFIINPDTNEIDDSYDTESEYNPENI
ncbi:MAG: hypothetical protein LBC86_00690 [Oscillospiraceae bacterium]|nr:hypothetical protein [Oscillospiraceae bacterium]